MIKRRKGKDHWRNVMNQVKAILTKRTWDQTSLRMSELRPWTLCNGTKHLTRKRVALNGT